MTTYTAFTTLKGRDKAYQLSEAMERLDPAPTGVGTFEIEDGSGAWEVAGYFLERPDDTALMLLASMVAAAPFAISRVDDRDWVAQVRRELTPVRSGRFLVHGAHDAHLVGVNQIGLRIEAAMAFGTGHHGTTLGCLNALNRLIKRGRVARVVADIGTGTGILAMAASSAFHCDVIATDLDPVAVATARANFKANGITGRVRTIRAAGFRDAQIKALGPFDLVFANILAGPLKAMSRDMSEHTASGGFIILSGILNRQAASVIARYESMGFHLRHSDRIQDWSTLTFEKT